MAQTRRDITREATVREIKDTALRLMRANGSTEVRFADIAREMKMSAPGLYRYFDGRDELITALIADAFTDLAATVAAARDTVDEQDPTGRLLHAACGLRSWGLAEPEQFALVFGPPIPGYTHTVEDGGLATEAGMRAMDVMKSVVFDARRIGKLSDPLVSEVSPALLAHFTAKHELEHHPDHDGIPPATMQSLFHCWSALHGAISLEVYGTLKFLGDACPGLFVGMVRMIAAAIGLPEPVGGWPDDPPDVPVLSGTRTGAA